MRRLVYLCGRPNVTQLRMMAVPLQGYFYKAASMESDLVTVADTAEVVIQAQVAQTLGMRILFFFPVTVRPLQCHPCTLLPAL